MYLEEKLALILEKLDRQEAMLKLFVPDLTKKKEVQHFLQITRQTMEIYISDSRIANGVHYFLDENQNLVFIPAAIIELKQSGIKYKKNRNTAQNLADNIISSIGSIAS